MVYVPSGVETPSSTQSTICQGKNMDFFNLLQEGVLWFIVVAMILSVFMR